VLYLKVYLVPNVTFQEIKIKIFFEQLAMPFFYYYSARSTSMLLHQANNSSMPEYDLFTWSAVGITVPVFKLKYHKERSHYYQKVLRKKNPRSFCGIKWLMPALE